MRNPDIYPPATEVTAVDERSAQLKDHGGAVYLMNSGVKSQQTAQGASLKLLSAGPDRSGGVIGVIGVKGALKVRCDPAAPNVHCWPHLGSVIVILMTRFYFFELP